MNKLVQGRIKRIGSRSVDITVDGSNAVYKNCALTSSISMLDVKEGLTCTVMLGRSGNTVLGINTAKSTDSQVNYFSSSQIQYIQNITNATYNNTYQIIEGTILSDPGVTGRRFFTHGTRLAQSIALTDTSIYLTHAIFSDGETLYLEKMNESFEYIMCTSDPVSMPNPAGGVYYQHTVERGLSGSTINEFPVYSMVYGLTHTGYIHTISKDNERSPMLSVKRWVTSNVGESLSTVETQEIFRAGNIYGILGNDTSRFGVFTGTTQSYTLFDSDTQLLSIFGTTFKVTDTSGESAFAVYAMNDGIYNRGDVLFGSDVAMNMKWTPSVGTLEIRFGDTPYISFDPLFGSVINHRLTVGEEGRATIQMGEINSLVSLYMRDRWGVPILSAVEDIDNDSIQVTIGRPEPNSGSMTFFNGLLDVHGTIRADYLELLGSVTSTEQTEILLQVPGQTERLHMTSKYMEGFDNLNKRTIMIAWKATTLDIDPAIPGVRHTWLAGEAHFGE